MRAVQVFILRLLVDPAEPEVLRGALQPLPDGPARPFSGEQMLLVLLHRSAALAAVVPGGAEIAIDAENGDN